MNFIILCMMIFLIHISKYIIIKVHDTTSKINYKKYIYEQICNIFPYIKYFNSTNRMINNTIKYIESDKFILHINYKDFVKLYNFTVDNYNPTVSSSLKDNKLYIMCNRKTLVFKTKNIFSETFIIQFTDLSTYDSYDYIVKFKTIIDFYRYILFIKSKIRKIKKNDQNNNSKINYKKEYNKYTITTNDVIKKLSTDDYKIKQNINIFIDQ